MTLYIDFHNVKSDDAASFLLKGVTKQMWVEKQKGLKLYSNVVFFLPIRVVS